MFKTEVDAPSTNRMRRCSSNSENIPILSASLTQSQCSSTFKRSDDSGPNTAGRNKFEATRKWTDLIATFIDEVPREDYRRFFRTHTDAFTGQVAADVLTNILPRIFTDRKCERTNGVRVLQKFLEDRIIEDVAGGSEFKDDATLYRLTDLTISKYNLSGPPAKIRRSASLNDKDRQTPVTTRDYSRPVKLTNFHSKTSQNFSFNSSQVFTPSVQQTPIRPTYDQESPPIPIPNDKRFARVIDFNNDDLESRRKFLDVQLTGLLDGIIADANLSDLERHKRLMEFKHNYPKIFADRYPENSYTAPPTPLLHRIKDFLGGN
uniref:DEP domain-containing protein n=1 Tax=Bursaphelenchus xylophilus TaxID=6326 RepID=A0A1I7RVZ4_BURXY